MEARTTDDFFRTLCICKRDIGVKPDSKVLTDEARNQGELASCSCTEKKKKHSAYEPVTADLRVVCYRDTLRQGGVQLRQKISLPLSLLLPVATACAHLPLQHLHLAHKVRRRITMMCFDSLNMNPSDTLSRYYIFHFRYDTDTICQPIPI